MAIGINLPQNNPGVGLDPSLIPTLPRRWGESDAAYRIRLQEFQAPYHQAAASRNAVETEAERQRQQIEEATYKKSRIASSRLEELKQLLAQEESRKFNQAIPSIAESAQAQGFLETSGFGNALARERANLAGQTQYELARQSLSDRDIELGGIDEASKVGRDLQVAGLERQFSENDLTRSERLARELAQYGVPAAPKSPNKNFFDQYGPALLTGTTAVLAGPGFGQGGAFNKAASA